MLENAQSAVVESDHSLVVRGRGRARLFWDYPGLVDIPGPEFSAWSRVDDA